MKSSRFRIAVVTGLTAVGALAITACSPALENPSEQKVDTATEFSATPSEAAATTATTTEPGATGTAATEADVVEAGAPSFIDCVAAPVQTPDTVSLNCADNSDSLTDIEWDQWGADEATGTGTRETVDETGEVTTVEATEIVLATPFQGPQGLVFTEITVDDAVVTP